MTDGVFVGRTEELARFKVLLAEMPVGKRRRSPGRTRSEDEKDAVGRKSRVVLVHGLGGTGKSRLLRRFREAADGVLPGCQVQPGQIRTAWLDFEDEEREKPSLYAAADSPSLVTLLDAVQRAVLGTFYSDAKARKMAAHAFADYRDGAARMPQYTARFADMYERSRQAGSQFTGQDARLLLRSLASAGLVVSGHPTGLLGLTPAQIAESAQAAGHLSDAAAHAITGKKPGEIPQSEYDLVTDSAEELTRRVASALRVVAARFPLAIFLDTGEIIGPVAWGWLRKVMVRTGVRIMWVAGARFETEAEASIRSPVAQFVREIGTAHLTLMVPTRFDDETIGEYLTARIPDCSYSEEQIDQIARFTRGVPLAVSLVADQLRQRQPVEEICRDVQDGKPSDIILDVTGRYLVHAEQQDDSLADAEHGDTAKIIGLALAYGDLPKDPRLLAALWNVTDPLRAFNDLAKRHDFVLDNSRRLHDDVRDVLLTALLDPYRRESRAVIEMNQRALDLYNDRLTAMRRRWPALDTQLAHSEYTTTLLAVLWHTLWADNQAGLDRLVEILPVLSVADQATADAAAAIAGRFAGTFDEDQRHDLELITTSQRQGWPQ